MEKNKDPASFLQDLHHLLCFPGGDSGPSQASLEAASSKGLSVVPREDSAQLRAFLSSIYCMPSVVLGSLGDSEEESVLACLHGTCGVFWEGSEQGLGDMWFSIPVVSACWFLLVAFKSWGRRRRLEAQKKPFGDAVVELVQMTLVRISQSWCQRSPSFPALCL